MAITAPCGLHGKVFTHNNRKYKVHSFSWNDGMYICETAEAYADFYC